MQVKRVDWCIDVEPRAPYAPTEPVKSRETTEFCQFYAAGCDDTMRLSDLVLPDGVKLEDVVIEIDACDGYATTVHFGTVKTLVRENARYASEMKRYAVDLMKHKKRMKEHEEELAEWRAWNEQEKTRRDSKKIDAARRLLKEHGFDVRAKRAPK